jgi:hypothetical protein
MKTAYSSKSAPVEAARELKEQLGDVEPRLIMFFASSHYDAQALGKALQSELGDVPAIGCTTAGEITSGEMLEGSVVMLALDDESVANAHVALVEDMHDADAVSRALASLADKVGTAMNQLDPARYVGIVLHDGLSVAEEKVMDRITDLTNVPFIGGSAGDDAKFERTHVFTGFSPRQGASALALIETRRPYHILKTQSFEVLDDVLTVTDVDEVTRTVRAFNGQPAAREYARVLGVPVEELPKRFQANPLGLVLADGEPFVRSPQQVRGDDVVFYCQVKPGMDLHVLRSRDIVEDTARDLSAKLAEIGSCRGVINFHCILRTLELKQKDQCSAYGKIFSDVPTVGFSTYGESYIGHINQTSTMLLLA